MYSNNLGSKIQAYAISMEYRRLFSRTVVAICDWEASIEFNIECTFTNSSTNAGNYQIFSHRSQRLPSLCKFAVSGATTRWDRKISSPKLQVPAL